MFDKVGIRKIIGLSWVVIFIILIGVYYFSIQPFKKQALTEINSIEENIANGEWDKTKDSQEKLNSLWKQYKILVLLNNLSPAVSRFEQKMAEVKELVKYKDKAALQFIGSLKDTLQTITKVTPTPEG